MTGNERAHRNIAGTSIRRLAFAVLAFAVLAFAVLALACRPPAPAAPGASGTAADRPVALEGRWTLCMTEETQGRGPLCAMLTAEARGTGPDSMHYAVTHELPLDSLLGTAHRPPPWGVIAPADSGRWRLLLGVDAGVVNAFDVGLHGMLVRSEDSLSGTWSHSCFAGCPERGRVVLRR